VAVVANYRLFDRAMVERLHGADLWALCYTVNDASAARRLLEWGLDGLITDAVDRFSPGAERLG
jgi:glycerophosphoryl diester phosphodiesterase